MKRLLCAVLVLILLAACTACREKNDGGDPLPEPSRKVEPLTRIDHCVVEPDARMRMSEKDMLAYRKLTEAMLSRRDSVEIEPDTVTADYLLDRLRRGPYYYFLSEAVSTDNEIRFRYAYTAEQQEEMLSFIDNEMLRIVNYETDEDDNQMDMILKIYLAVTHEMTYDTERTDNKKLGSPLFEYPADEIYKALRDKKSLCYGFAYVLRFAFLQRDIDCFCVYGLCTTHGDGHEWVVFRYGEEWYHCDPAWDRVDGGYSKLIHFGKTDRERAADSLVPEDFASCHDPSFGAIECTDDLFSIFRGIRRFSYAGGHRWFTVDIHSKESYFDSGTFTFTDR